MTSAKIKTEAGADKIEVTMNLMKETKGALRYEEGAEVTDPAIGNLYIRKSAYTGRKTPMTITVTVTTTKTT